VVIYFIFQLFLRVNKDSLLLGYGRKIKDLMGCKLPFYQSSWVKPEKISFFLMIVIFFCLVSLLVHLNIANNDHRFIFIVISFHC